MTTTTSSLPVAFGVEIETLLIFTEPLLRHHLSTTTTQPCDIIKQIPDHARRALNQVTPSYQLKNPKYMGWALSTPATYDDGPNERGYDRLFEGNFREFGYRGYGGEILTLVQEILMREEEEGKGVRVHDHFSHCHDFSRWHLTHDTSLVGVSKEELAVRLRDTKRCEIFGKNGFEDVDSHPFELVSQVLPVLVQESSFEQISRYLALLVGAQDSEHTAIATELCGMHVHIGLPMPVEVYILRTEPRTFGLETLQHLAYLLVMYERSTGMLFPGWRRVGSEASRVDIISNLEEFFEEGDWDINATDDDDGNLDDTKIDMTITTSECTFDDGNSCGSKRMPDHPLRQKSAPRSSQRI